MPFDAGKLRKLLAEFGVVVFKGASANLEAAKSFTERFAHILKTVEVTGSEYVGYHGELTYTPFPPDLLCFHCESPPVGAGGETTFCDGIAVARRLGPGARELFESRRLKMVSEWSSRFLIQRLGLQDERQIPDFFATHPGVAAEPVDGQWRLTFVRSALSRTRFQGEQAFVNSILIALHDRRDRPERAYSLRFEDDSELPETLIEEIHALSEDLTQEYCWGAGDYAVVDNSRMLHGRRRCEKGSESRRKLVNFHSNFQESFLQDAH
jgi:alpha-ketoglutarate-dependent taurine dioxygenase